jgi:hypothetical protein
MIFYLNNYLIALGLLITAITSSPIAEIKALIPRQDGTCDPANPVCPPGACCSFWGYW